MEALNSALALIRRILHTVDEGLEASAVPPIELSTATATQPTAAVVQDGAHAATRPIGSPCIVPEGGERPYAQDGAGAVSDAVLRLANETANDATQQARNGSTSGAADGPSPGDQGFDELQDLLDSIGAEPAAPDPDAQIRLKDATIHELTSMLAALRPLGDQLAATERARLDLKERTERLGDEVAELRRLLVLASEELEDERERFELRIEQEAERASASDPLHDEVVADYEARLATALESADASEKKACSLESKLAKRERVLAAERERHAATREKLAERKKVAAERWNEIRSLRAELKQRS